MVTYYGFNSIINNECQELKKSAVRELNYKIIRVLLFISEQTIYLEPSIQKYFFYFIDSSDKNYTFVRG